MTKTSVCVFSGEATLPDWCPPRGDAIGWTKLLPPDIPGSGASDGHRPSVRLDRLQKSEFLASAHGSHNNYLSQQWFQEMFLNRGGFRLSFVIMARANANSLFINVRNQRFTVLEISMLIYFPSISSESNQSVLTVESIFSHDIVFESASLCAVCRGQR